LKTGATHVFVVYFRS